MSVRNALPFLLLSIFAVQAGSAISQHSVTIDEYAHVPSGYSYWKTGVFSIYHQNPPLIKLWCTLPFLFIRPDLGFSIPPLASAHPQGEENSPARCIVMGKKGIEQNPWECGRLFLMSNFAQYQFLFDISRMMILLLAIVLGILLFIWATKLYGFPIATLALFLYSFCPNMLAHSQLATPDVGFCLTTLFALFTFWGFCKDPGRKTVLLSGTALGLAQLSKFTALLLYPVFLLLAVIYCLLDRKPIKNHLAGLFVIFFLSLMIINMGYLFQGTFSDLNSFNITSSTLSALSQTIIGRIPIPLPSDFIQGFDVQMMEAEGGHIVFLNGVLSTHGWWYYFIEAFILKTPLPLLFLVALRCIVPVRGIRTQDAIFFTIPILAFLFSFSFLTDIDIGLRYILPVYPLIFLWVSPVITEPMFRRHKTGTSSTWPFPAAAVLILLLYAQSSVRIFPHHLSYFNILAGGPENGHKYLIDSNIDWGQDLPQLKRLMEERGIPRISLAYFGVVAPEVYGISYDLPSLYPPPRPGYLAVSVSILQGKGEWFPRIGGTWVFLPENALTWVKRYHPAARAGYSIYLYRLP